MEKDCDGHKVEALLLEAIRENMNTSGEMNKIESEVRAMVLNELRSGDKSSMNSMPSNEKSPTRVANHLILEYLDWMNFQYTKELFEKESGDKSGPSRSIVESQIDGTKSTFDKDIPILMKMTLKLMEN